MNDDFSRVSAETESTEPTFGVVEIVEAFTALRHELRGQLRENRQLADSVKDTFQALQQIEQTLDQKLETVDPDQSQRLAELVIEMDQGLERAIEAASRSAERASSAAIEQWILDRYRSASWLTRWLGKRWMQELTSSIREEYSDEANSVLDGLKMLRNRVQRGFQAGAIKRVDTLGLPFDPQTMKAIASVASDAHPPGHVAEQLSAAWYFRGQLFRFAEVRVAKKDGETS